MACGNNKVSRSGLQTQPAPLSHPSVATIDQAARQRAVDAARQADRRIDQAKQALQSATSPSAVRSALQSAQKALDDARRAGGNKAAKTQLRALEKQVEQLRRQAGDRTAELAGRDQARAMAVHDSLGRQSLGVPIMRQHSLAPSTRQATPTQRGESPGQMASELAELRSPGADRQQIGDFSEAVAAGFMGLVLDYGLLSQHNIGDKPQGLDIVAISPMGQIETIEVKGTAKQHAGKPQTNNTKTAGKQAGAAWVVSRSQDGPISAPSTDAVGTASDQMVSRVCRVDLRDGTISLWAVDQNGKLANTPDLMAPLDQVVQAIDGI